MTQRADALGLSPSARAQLGVAEVRTTDGQAALMEREPHVSRMDAAFLDPQVVESATPGSK